MKWTDEQDARLRQLWAEGLTATVIAAEMGKTRNAVLGRVHRLPGFESRMDKAARPANGPVIYLHPQKMRDNRPKIGRAGPSMPTEAGIKTLPVQTPVAPRPRKLRLSILDVKDGFCKFPISEDPTLYGGHRFCGDKAHGQSPYCEAHHKTCYGSAPRPWSRAEDEFVLTHWQKGQGIIQIAKTLDRPKAVVALRARQLRAA